MTSRQPPITDYKLLITNMRILVIWGESLSKPGGGTVHCKGLCNGWHQGGHHVTIVTPGYGCTHIVLEASRVYAVPLPRRSVLSFALFQMITVLSLPWWILRYKPNAVYVRTCFLQALMAMICRLFHIPLIGEIDSLIDQEVLMRNQPVWIAKLARWLETFNACLSQGLVCVSEGLRQDFIRRGKRPETVLAAHNGVVPEAMTPVDQRVARQTMALPENKIIFGFAGSLAPWQGLDFFVQAIRHLKESGRSDILIAVLGTGRMEANLHRWIDEYHLQNFVTMLAPLPHEKIPVFLSACDAGVIPIRDKRKLGYCSPLKFWEMISIGLPTLVPTRLELDDVLTELDIPGTFDPDDPVTLADRMVYVADNVDMYRPRREEIHARVAAKYSWRNVADNIVTFADQLRCGR